MNEDELINLEQQLGTVRAGVVKLGEQLATLTQENMHLKMKARHFAQALLDLQATAQRLGDSLGTCDCIDANNNPYQSAWLSDLLQYARRLVREEQLAVNGVEQPK